MNEDYSNGISTIIRNGFWFIDIPRTSSSSIRVELGRQFGSPYGKTNLLEKEYSSDQLFPDHFTALEMIYILGENNWNKLFTFSIVRNPWDRAVSLYNYRKIKGNIPAEWDFSMYIQNLKNATADTEYFTYHGFRLGAIDYLINEKREIIVDFIVKFENRMEDLMKLSKILKFNILGEIMIQKASPTGMHYSEYYNEETMNIVKNLYSEEIKTFNYRFDKL
jgi:hypothetical protein